MIKIKILKEKEQFIGGAGDNIPDSDFDPEMLELGIDKEMHDHGFNREQAKETSKDEFVTDEEGYKKELSKKENIEEGFEDRKSTRLNSSH